MIIRSGWSGQLPAFCAHAGVAPSVVTAAAPRNTVRRVVERIAISLLSNFLPNFLPNFLRGVYRCGLGRATAVSDRVGGGLLAVRDHHAGGGAENQREADRVRQR